MTEIVLVGEAWGKDEEEAQAPFVGPTGYFLNSVLRSVGIDREKCFVTNVFNLRPKPSNDISNLCGLKAEAIPNMPRLANGKYISNQYANELVRLYREIDIVSPTIIIALGATASWALLKTSGIKRIRGSAYIGYNGYKIFPTYHPTAIMREFSLRPIFYSDLEKAKVESTFKEVRRPPREFWLEPSLDDLHEFDKQITATTALSIDIETAGRQITCIGFAPSERLALVVPFVSSKGSYWPSHADELVAWSYIRRWCALPNARVVGQNFLYDIKYLWNFYGIPVPSAADDTMLMHHAMQPEMEKGLGFLASLYTTEPAWKFMRDKHQTIKTEE